MGANHRKSFQVVACRNTEARSIRKNDSNSDERSTISGIDRQSSTLIGNRRQAEHSPTERTISQALRESFGVSANYSRLNSHAFGISSNPPHNSETARQIALRHAHIGNSLKWLPRLLSKSGFDTFLLKGGEQRKISVDRKRQLGVPSTKRNMHASGCSNSQLFCIREVWVPIRPRRARNCIKQVG